jgi:DNA-directed RNA polymerase subunit H (RpoH/RPB5)
MQNNAKTITQIYNARKVLLQQLGQQGYNISSYSNFGINEINILYQQSGLDMILEKEEGRVYVRYFTGKLFRPGNIRELVDDLLLNNVITKKDTVIFITQDDINDTIKDFVKQLWEEEKLFILLLNLKRLQFNILEHILVPEHTIIYGEEIDNMVTKYKLKHISLLPEISRFDPVALSIGMRPGDICKIIRPSKTSITSVYFRICVNN